MITSKFNSKSNSYTVDLNDNALWSAMLYVDTGAAYTIVNFDVLGLFYDRDSLENELKKQQVFKREFGAISSKGVSGYLCNIMNCRINDEEVKKFFFYLSFDAKNSLLGMDYLNFCNINKNGVGGDLVLSDFNSDEYEKYYEKLQAYDIGSSMFNLK